MAGQTDWFRGFVERSLQEVWESPEIIQDGDGDYPFGDQGRTSYVSVWPAPVLGVCVWSYAAHGVKGQMFAVVHGAVSAQAEPQAS